ncbi:hypothetical protein F4778DRAFT_457284 [Xylariomycetidae sp. FL2044]|nr:hypothetical protein F4778DRAFT_457284 [Xylariomycetidae sp. FL2044]
MRMQNFHGHGHRHLLSRAPRAEIEQMGQLEARSALQGGDGSTPILPRSSQYDEKPATGSSNALPIALGVVIPVVLALCVLFYFHRRTAKRQKQEDEADKYKSMDFGLEETVPSQTGKRRSAFFGKEKDSNHKGQLSMDMNLSSPYLLPPTLQHSRESLNSLARSLNPNEDPYRPVASYAGSDVGSLRSFQRGNRASSIYTGKTRLSGDRDRPKVRPTVNVNELPERQRSLPPSPLQDLPATSQPPSRKNSGEGAPQASAKNDFSFGDNEPGLAQVPEIQEPPAVLQIGHKGLRQESRPLSNDSLKIGQANVPGHVNDRDSVPTPHMDAPRDAHGLGIVDPHLSQNSMDMPAPRTSSLPPSARPPRKESMPVIETTIAQDYQDYAQHFQADMPDVTHIPYGSQAAQQHLEEHDYPHSAGLGLPEQDNRRLSVGFRPLPPDEFLESEDPEFRANRIRSFYKEYFEETKVDHGRPPPIPQQATYYEDYDANYLGDAAFFDPDTNAFVMPYAEPVTRRAMTPPPNSRRPMPGPRSRGPNGPHGPHGSMGLPPPGRPRAGSTMSGGRWGPRSPRPGSSASNPRFGGKPKKPVPPPSALSTLPTPSKLRDDSFAIMGAIDFAPPPTFKDQAAGRSQSPLGERRPYAVATPVHSPLVSAFDDTPALPSPHLLRKSGTFTALDFAPPRRFKDPDSMSETGSIRSNRSGISTANLSAIRGGAGRVSRLPGDTVFSQAAMQNTLKPSWNMRD